MDEMPKFLDKVRAELNRLYLELWTEYIPAEPARLFHYTSVEGLVGIISTRKFFLSDMLASTDQSEIHHGIGVIRSVLEMEVADLITKSLMGSLEKTDLWSIGNRVFVCAVCFCTGNDVLTQWRGYSPSGGFAIGVDFNELKRRSEGGEFALSKMLYDRVKQQEIVRRIINGGREFLPQVLSTIKDIQEEEGQRAVAEFLGEVAICLVKACLFFKHEAFSSEEEWRLITLVRSDQAPRFKFRIRGKTITPYTELLFEPSLITEVRCSPGVWSRSALYGINQLAKSLGSHLHVTQSGLPL